MIRGIVKCYYCKSPVSALGLYAFTVRNAEDLEVGVGCYDCRDHVGEVAA